MHVGSFSSTLEAMCLRSFTSSSTKIACAPCCSIHRSYVLSCGFPSFLGLHRDLRIGFCVWNSILRCSNVFATVRQIGVTFDDTFVFSLCVVIKTHWVLVSRSLWTLQLSALSFLPILSVPAFPTLHRLTPPHHQSYPLHVAMKLVLLGIKVGCVFFRRMGQHQEAIGALLF